MNQEGGGKVGAVGRMAIQKLRSEGQFIILIIISFGVYESFEALPLDWVHMDIYYCGISRLNPVSNGRRQSSFPLDARTQEQ